MTPAAGRQAGARDVVAAASLLALLLAAPACRTIHPPADEETVALIARTRALQPGSWDATQALIFEIKLRWWQPAIRMTMLGYATFDAGSGDYRLVCLSPLGIRMFEVSRTAGIEQAVLPSPELQKKPLLVESIRRDASRLIAPPLPDRFTVAASSPSLATIEGANGSSHKVVCEISVPDRVVLSASFFEGDRRAADVRYEDYRDVDGARVPHRVVLVNRQHRYRLTLSVKEFHRRTGHRAVSDETAK